MNKKFKTLIFIKNPTDPSAYYRLTQYFQKSENICYCKYSSDWIYNWYYDVGKKRSKSKRNKIINIFRKGILATYGILHNSFWILYYRHVNIDNFVISRTVFPRVFPFYSSVLLKRLFHNSNVIWDFDDNIIDNKEISTKEVEILLNYSSQIIVSNHYLKDILPDRVHDKVKILCTSDRAFENEDVDRLIKKRLECYSKTINLIWVGTRDNVKYLNSIMDILDHTAQELKRYYEKQLVIWCVSNTNIKDEYQWIQVKNIVWSRETAIDLLKKAHLGLMPLVCDRYTLGKAGFKAVQYISSGMPAIVSDVGYCKEVITDGRNGFVVSQIDEWKDAIIKLSTNEELYLRYSYAARNEWKKKFDSKVNQLFWEELS